MSSLVAALLLLAPAGPTVTWRAEVGNDTSFGYVSVAPGQVSRPALSTALTPGGALTMVDGQLQVDAAYRLRLFRRFEFGDPPPPEDPGDVALVVPEIPRFLLMHNLSTTARYDMQMGWTVSAGAGVNVGEVDVAGAAGVLLDGQDGGGTGTDDGVVPGRGDASAENPGSIFTPTDDGVISTLAVDARAGLSGAMARDIGLAVDFTFTHTRPLDDAGEGTVGLNFIPVQTTFAGQAAFTYRLSRADNFTFTLGASHSSSDFGGTFRDLNAQIGYSRILARQVRFTAAGGVGYFTLIEEPEANFAFGVLEDTVAPMVNVALQAMVLQRRDIVIDADAGLRIRGQQNAIVGIFEPRGTASLQVGARLPPSWGVALQASLSAPGTFGERATADPGDDPAGDILANQFLISETVLQLEIPVTYSFSDEFSFSGGFRYITYGPRLGTPGFTFANPTYVGFVQATLAVSQTL